MADVGDDRLVALDSDRLGSSSLNVEDINRDNRRAVVRSKGGDIDLLHFQTGSARLIPRLMAKSRHTSLRSLQKYPDRAQTPSLSSLPHTTVSAAAAEHVATLRLVWISHITGAAARMFVSMHPTAVAAKALDGSLNAARFNSPPAHIRRAAYCAGRHALIHGLPSLARN